MRIWCVPLSLPDSFGKQVEKSMQLFFRTKPIYEIAGKTAQQHFEGKDSWVLVLLKRREMSAVTTLWVLLTKYKTITFMMNSSDELPQLLTDLIRLSSDQNLIWLHTLVVVLTSSILLEAQFAITLHLCSTEVKSSKEIQIRFWKSIDSQTP